MPPCPEARTGRVGRNKLVVHRMRLKHDKHSTLAALHMLITPSHLTDDIIALTPRIDHSYLSTASALVSTANEPHLPPPAPIAEIGASVTPPTDPLRTVPVEMLQHHIVPRKLSMAEPTPLDV